VPAETLRAVRASPDGSWPCNSSGFQVMAVWSFPAGADSGDEPYRQSNQTAGYVTGTGVVGGDSDRSFVLRPLG
jgi:hypothetical protein